MDNLGELREGLEVLLESIETRKRTGPNKVLVEWNENINTLCKTAIKHGVEEVRLKEVDNDEWNIKIEFA
jgi:hypothetical protein